MNRVTLPLDAIDQMVESGYEISVGETAVSCDRPLVTCVGASVAVCLFSDTSNWSGLRQIMVPSLTHGHRHDSLMTADAGLEELVSRTTVAQDRDLVPFRRRQNDYIAKIFGGATIRLKGASFADSAQTILFVRSWLRTRQIKVVAESLGGSSRRQLIVCPSDKRVFCKRIPLNAEFLDSERAILISPHYEANRIELF